MRMGKFSNRLAEESSLYLRQHASNPVNWYPWGDEAKSAAKAENKLLLISIGYSSCHWCHVMEKESFENEEVAEVMNRNYVSIKVDREERPDIDNIYMTAVQMLNNGSGGWPLNCIALPDGRPIWGGTYFRPEQWKELLTRIAEYYRQNASETERYAAELAGEVVKATAPSTTDRRKRYTITDLKAGVRRWSQSFDNDRGGQMGAPKFPMPVNLSFLMRYSHLFQESEITGHVKMTLKKMAAGGIYDQAGGGFARYSVDPDWYVPHFEKMLYDNAQLLALYSDAWLKYGDEQFKDVVYHTVEFLKREMLGKNSLFYSSIDADSEGEEGRFYVWTPEELDAVNLIGRDLFNSYYLIERDNLWEGKYHLLRSVDDDSEFAQSSDISVETLAEMKSQWRRELLKARELRERPVTDTKTITAWNALMAEALIRAGRAFHDESLISMAAQTLEAISGKSNTGNSRLNRLAGSDEESAEGFLDDYAFTIRSAISLGEVTMDERWTDMAVRITDYLLEQFYSTTDTLFWYSRKDSYIVLTNYYELYDNVIPSSNSVMASNLFRLSMLGRGSQYGSIAGDMMNAMAGKMVSHPYAYAGWASHFSDINLPYGQIVVTGPQSKEVVGELAGIYLPNAVMAATDKPNEGELFKNRYADGETAIYLCIDNSCQLPVSNIEELMPLLDKLKVVSDS